MGGNPYNLASEKEKEEREERKEGWVGGWEVLNSLHFFCGASTLYSELGAKQDSFLGSQPR